MAALATVRQRTVSSRDVSTATKHSQGGAEPTKAKETLMAELLRAGERRGASATEVAEIAGALLSELDRDSPPEGARGRGALTTANLARRRQSRACLVFALVMRFALLVCKAVWLTLLAIAAFALACWLSPSLLFFVSKHMHSRMHHVVFALRRVLVSAVPLWAWLNLDPTQPCMVENALLDPSQLCPCLHVAKATEGYLADDSGLLPHEIFKKDDHFYVFRDVLEIDRNFGLSAFQNHHKVHGENPQSCLEVGSSYDVGPKFYHQLFDQSFMEEALESNTSWSFTWSVELELSGLAIHTQNLKLTCSKEPPSLHLPSSLSLPPLYVTGWSVHLSTRSKTFCQNTNSSCRTAFKLLAPSFPFLSSGEKSTTCL